MISDEIIYHFQSIKKDLSVGSFASEVEANLIKDFFGIRYGQNLLVLFSYRISKGLPLLLK